MKTTLKAKTIYIAVFAFLILFGVYSLLTERQKLSTGGSVETETFTLPGEDVQVTDGVRHTVPLEAILSGGPPKDGIPSIDNPSFVNIEEADEYLDDEGLGISVSVGDTHRFYPNQILVWHEIVNDEIEGQPVLVTYCPLCGTGLVFKPIVKGKPTEFGTSGKLWNSNLVMYDRQTDSYWSQVLGQGIVGEMASAKLPLLPHDNLQYKHWKELYPNGEVLSRETGFVRNYNRDPYGGYYENTSIYFPVDHESEEFHPKEVVYGVRIGQVAKAYTLQELEKGPETFQDFVDGVPINLSFDPRLKRLDIRLTGTDTEIVAEYGFWFSWFSVHPDTEIYRAP